MNQDFFNVLMGLMLFFLLAGFGIGYCSARGTWQKLVNQLNSEINNRISMHHEEMTNLRMSMRSQQRVHQANNQSVNLNVDLAGAIEQLQQAAQLQQTAAYQQPRTIEAHQPRMGELTAAQLLAALPAETVSHIQAHFNPNLKKLAR